MNDYIDLSIEYGEGKKYEITLSKEGIKAWAAYFAGIGTAIIGTCILIGMWFI